MFAYLISIQDLKDSSTLSNNIDDKIFYNSIYDAQNIDLVPIIGSKLYDKLIEMVIDETLSGSTNYSSLVENYIYPFLVKKSLVRVLIFLYSKFKNLGVVNQSSENSSFVDIKIIDKMREELNNDAENYSNRLKKFLIDNMNTYIEYKDWSNNLVSDVAPDVNNSFQSTLFFDEGGCMGNNNLTYIVIN